ncbi:MAG: glycosyltransferase family 4 protein [Phycisphaerae bacterium]
MRVVCDTEENRSALSISAALCIDGRGLDLLGPVLRHLAVGLVDKAVHVRLVGPDARIESLGLGPIQSLVHEPIVWPSAVKRIARTVEALSQNPPTVVHAIACGSYAIATAIAEAYDADLVVQVTSLTDCEALGRLTTRQLRRCLAFSQPLAAILQNQERIPPERIDLVRPGVLAAKDIACFAQEGREPTILCTAPFVKDAGVDLLIEATAGLRARGHPPMVFLLGQGPHESALRRLVRLRNLAACVTFARPLGDVADAMQGADIYVRPHIDTVLDIDSLQAMGAGLCTVTLANALCDYIRNDETAIVSEAPTAASLAKAIERLLMDHNAARQLAATGIEYVRTHHAMSGMAERAAAVYRKLALARATFPIKE